MSRYPGVAALIEAGGRRSTRQDFADRIATKSTQVQDAQEALADNSIVPNTRVPPSPPTGVFVRPRNRGMDLSWAAPPATDYVSVTEVVLVRVSDNTTTIHKFEGKLLAGSINGLDPVDYDVSLQHRNKFGEASGFTTPALRIAPTPTIAEQIAADIQIAAGQITGQLGEAQVPTITSPAKLAQAVYEAAADAAGKGANLFPWPEAEFENYDLGAFTPASTGAGMTASVVSNNGRKWLRVSRPAGALGSALRPFDYSDNTDGSAGDYFISCDAKNAGANAVSVAVTMQRASDAAGTGAVTSTAPPVLVAAGETRRIWIRYARDSTLRFVRHGIVLPVDGTSILTTRWMHENASGGQTLPSAYRVPAITVGAMAAKLLAAWDLTAVRAIIGNLTVESAKVVSLAAEKFVGGTITGQEFVLAAGGRFRTANNGTRIDDGGITLEAAASFNTPAMRLDQKISSLADKAAYAFYADATTGFRGAVVRSDGGNTDATRGAVSLHATYAGSLGAASSARVEVLAASVGGQVNVYGDLVVNADTIFKGFARINGLLRQRNSNDVILELDSTAVAASTGVLTVTHGLVGIPFVAIFQWNEGGIWRPMVDGVASWRIGVTGTEVTISNLASTPTSRAVRGVIFR